MAAPTLSNLDHIVLTVRDMAETCRFYTQVLGMRLEMFHPADGSERRALHFGGQKINLHLAAEEFAPHASFPTPGSADLCFTTDATLTHWAEHLSAFGIAIEQGPVMRTGALGPVTSLYLRDPDDNLLEIARYDRPPALPG